MEPPATSTAPMGTSPRCRALRADSRAWRMNASWKWWTWFGGRDPRPDASPRAGFGMPGVPPPPRGGQRIADPRRRLKTARAGGGGWTMDHVPPGPDHRLRRTDRRGPGGPGHGAGAGP